MHIGFYLKKSFKFKFLSFGLFFLFSIASLSYWALSFQKDSDNQNTPESVKLPIIMYHLVLKNPGNKNKFIISESTFEEDLKYIRDNGYTTILIKDLIDYTEGKSDLPSKPILLTFDDGAYNNYLYAFPLAKKYNSKFVFSPICKECERYSEISDENPTYAHANWNHISEMYNSGLIEIQNHTYDMHSNKKTRIGCTKISGESKEEYKSKLTNDLTKAQEIIKQKVGTEPTGFFYPFGACSDCSDEIIKELGFKATFLCESKVNHITRDPNSLFKLHRFLRPPNMSSKTFFSTFEK